MPKVIGGIPCPVVVAEAGNNHEGSLDVALELIEKAQEAGADLVKFQAGTAEGFARTPEDVERYRKYELGKDGYRRLAQRGIEIGIPVFFSVWSAEFGLLAKLPWFKIPARQCNPDNVAAADRSTTLVSIPHDYPNPALLGIKRAVPLHCVSQYPAAEPMLGRLIQLRETLGMEVGYSDHTVGIESAVFAAHALGAVVIEKHFTLAHDFGPLRDHQLSATPEELSYLVSRIKKR